MSSIDSFAAAFEGLRQSYEAGRVAHAYVIIGSPTGNGLALAESFLQLLFCERKEKPCGSCDPCRKVKEHSHPDTLWLKPESKSRKITIDQIREDLAPRISQTSYSGGWKAGVIVHADRLTDDAANAFLKTLEEPPGSSILLLLTDAAQHLLPTIISRCQRIMLGADETPDQEALWRGPLMEFLRKGFPGDSIETVMQSNTLRAILEASKQAILADEKERAGDHGEEDEDAADARVAARVVEVRSQIMKQVLLWQRDVLITVLGGDDGVLQFPDEVAVIRQQASGLSYFAALERLRSVDTMVRRLERNVPDEAVFETGLRPGRGD